MKCSELKTCDLSVLVQLASAWCGTRRWLQSCCFSWVCWVELEGLRGCYWSMLSLEWAVTCKALEDMYPLFLNIIMWEEDCKQCLELTILQVVVVGQCVFCAKNALDGEAQSFSTTRVKGLQNKRHVIARLAEWSRVGPRRSRHVTQPCMEWIKLFLYWEASTCWSGHCDVPLPQSEWIIRDK